MIGGQDGIIFHNQVYLWKKSYLFILRKVFFRPNLVVYKCTKPGCVIKNVDLEQSCHHIEL